MDSMLVYRNLDIVTAKPTKKELASAPLAAIDLADTNETFTVAKYLEEAETNEKRILESGRVPLFVGGTGLYLKALTHGLFEGPAADAKIRAELTARADAEGVESVYADLLRLDPAAASRIHPRDRKRIIRALEVFTLTGEPISKLQREWTLSLGFPRVLVGLRVERDDLHRRIARRVDAMLDAGLVDEVRRAREVGISREAGLAVGIPEVLAHLEGKTTLRECRDAIVLHTRQLARRQATWFRSYKEVIWIDAGEGRPVEEIAAQAVRTLELEF
jgi:tRNA dimethylallyltransferase